MRIVENLKSLVLTILILSSLVLTGSLWFDNYQGLSLTISKIPNLFSNKINSEEYSKIYDEIIMPYKVTVINPDDNKWISYNSDKMVTDAWNILKNRLSNLSSEAEIITGKVRDWDELINRKSIILEFGGPVDQDIFALAIPKLPKETEAFKNVEKFSITKSLVGNTIYIMQNDDGERKLYKILLKEDDEEIKTFMQSCENIKADVRYVNLEELGIKNFYNNKSIVGADNVLFPLVNNKNKRDEVSKISVKKHFNDNDEYQMGRFVTEVFNNTDFAKFITSENSKIYINDDKSSIKINEDGIVEYINNGKVSDEETSTGKNFNAALDFINNTKIFEHFFLLNATNEDNVYTFRFGIAFDGVIAGLTKPIINDDKYSLIEIKVQNNEVRYFKGKMIKLELDGEKKYVTNVTHNILDNLLKYVDKDSKISISDLSLVYDVSNEGSYYPCWMTSFNLPKSETRMSKLYVTNR